MKDQSTADGHSQQALSGVEQEKLFSVEGRASLVRLVIIASGTVIYPLFIDKATTVPWLAYALLVLAWVYGFYVYLAEPYRRHPLYLSSHFISVTDSVFTMLWLFATGGVASPFYVALYLAVVGIAFRYSAREGAFAAIVYAGSYLALLGLLGQIAGHVPDIVVRVTYILVAALLGAQVAGEVRAQVAARLEMRERVRRAEQVEEANRRLREANEVLHQANLALETVDRAKDEFLSVVSHELRTPLNHIIGFASLLEDGISGDLNPDQLEHVNAIQKGAERMTALVIDLLDYAQIRAGRLKVCCSQTLAEPLLESAIASVVPLAARGGLRLETDIDAPDPVWADEARLMQVLANLLSNAVKFTPPGGKVRVFARNDSGLLVRVVDSGPGIAPADLPKLFHQFQQLDMSSTRRAGGTGLGLAISKALVEAQGGEIGVESTLGKGSLFWFRLSGGAQIPVAR